MSFGQSALPPALLSTFVQLFPVLAEIANRHWFRLTTLSEIDGRIVLLCIPWVEDSQPADMLMLSYLNRFKMQLGNEFIMLNGPVSGPHRREIWTYSFGMGVCVDLHVLPPYDPEPSF